MTGRRKRLAADLPQHWLHDPEWFALSDRAWRLHTHGLMFAIGRTDGFIAEEMLGVLIRGTWDELQVALKELAAAGHWELVPGGWQILQWQESQSTVEQIEHNRAKWRRQKAQQKSNPSTVESRAESAAEATPEYGTARHGTEGQGQGSSDVCLGCDLEPEPGRKTCVWHADLEPGGQR